MKSGRIFITFLFISSLFISLPSHAFAVIQTLNGQTGQNQSFINDTNLTISSSGNNHTLGWNGLLPISRGGTGTSAFTDGSIPFISNGIFSENPKLKWGNTSGVFNLILGDDGGESGNRSQLILAQGSNLRLRNTDPLGNQEIVFEGKYGGSGPGELLFNISYESDTFDGLFISSYASGGGMAIDRISGNIVLGSIGNTDIWPPKGTVQIQDNTDAFDNNTTLYIGGADFNFPPSTKTKGCLVMGDSDGDGVTYITVNDGVLTASATKPSICQ